MSIPVIFISEFPPGERVSVPLRVIIIIFLFWEGGGGGKGGGAGRNL